MQINMVERQEGRDIIVDELTLDKTPMKSTK